MNERQTRANEKRYSCMSISFHLKGYKRIFLISNGKILKQEEQVYPYKKNVYASPYTGIIETELHRAGELYEVHFLLRNVDSTGNEKIWYLTIAGTNVEVETKK